LRTGGWIYTSIFRVGGDSLVRNAGAKDARFTTRRRRHGGIWISSSIARICTRARRDYVWRAVEALDLSEVRRIAADETSARRGHDYISLFVDMARRKVVYVAEGKDAATVKEFAAFL
jgi:transposase